MATVAQLLNLERDDRSRRRFVAAGDLGRGDRVLLPGWRPLAERVRIVDGTVTTPPGWVLVCFTDGSGGEVHPTETFEVIV